MSSHYQAVAEEAILDHFRNPEHEPFHSDDLWHVIPDEQRGVISLAVMALVNKKVIVGCGYRKSAIPSRKRSPSQEYRLTELGRDKIVGAGAGSVGLGTPSCASTRSGDPQSARHNLGGPSSETEGVHKPAPDRYAEVDREEGSGAGRQSAPEPEPLSLLPEVDPEAWAA